MHQLTFSHQQMGMLPNTKKWRKLAIRAFFENPPEHITADQVQTIWTSIQAARGGDEFDMFGNECEIALAHLVLGAIADGRCDDNAACARIVADFTAYAA